MRRGEKTAVAIAVILGLVAVLWLDLAHVEAGRAWDAFQRTSTTGREEAAAGYLIAATIHRCTQIAVLLAAIGAILLGVAVSRREAPEQEDPQ